MWDKSMTAEEAIVEIVTIVERQRNSPKKKDTGYSISPLPILPEVCSTTWSSKQGWLLLKYWMSAGITWHSRSSLDTSCGYIDQKEIVV